MSATERARFCDHCELPVGAGGVRRSAGDEALAFCCIGCSIAFRLGGATRREGGSQAASFLARIGLGFVFSMVTMLIQWVQYIDPGAAADPTYGRIAPIAQWITCTPVMVVLGIPFLWNAAVQLRSFRIGADLLVGLGILAGYGVSCATVLRGETEPLFFDTAAALATLVTVGRWLEASAKRKATAGLRAFLSGARRPATRIDDRGGEEAVKADTLQVGDRVRVLPGEAIPADGRIVKGRALLDEAALTGEALPRAVKPGDTVRAPAVPRDGPLEIEVTHVGESTLLAEVGRVLARARAQRAPVERLVDRVAAVFVPAVLALAAVVFALDLGAGREASDAVLHALSVLVVACPCALGIATPLAVSAVLGRLAERGILVRSGHALSDLRRVDTIAFDKTGTLTTGRARIEQVEALGALSEDELLRLAASAEQGSEHPYGASILRAARERGLDLYETGELRVHPGRGIKARVQTPAGTRHVRVGNAAWLGLEEERGYVAVEVDGTVAGRLRLADPLREGAAEAVRALKDAGVAPAVLSGDAAPSTARVAAELGLPAGAAHGGLLPDEKVRAVRSLQSAARGAVAFVGDGLNDAPALAAADLGIAVGSGTDLAKESADVSLLGNDLRRLPGLLRAAAVTRRAVGWNLFWAFLYNGAAVTWTVVHGLPPVLAALAMVLSSLFVIGNSVRLRAALPAVLAFD